MRNAQKQKTTKNTGGRPPGSRLDHTTYQDLLRLNVAKTGKEAGCWVGVCSENLFLQWKKRNRAHWTALFDAALAEYRLQVSLASPLLLEKALSQLQERIDAGTLNDKTLFEVVKYFDARRMLS